ncbi:hypothetical protein [Rhodoferax sp.]|uniref:hypothetical protein n=1 Tax=Rhodoferax sp. TaxID=50421 RepID=UPI002718C2F1|nr:hypothetical protein [Rhodoferax sp.]MDO8320735.1 hypothetical protein [Rhodoferax sp.]
MNNSTKCLGFALVAFALHTAASAADVGVSVNISEPGFYGRIDIGRVPAPVLIYSQPVIIEPLPVNVMRQPIYLRVPPGHEKKWDKHCRRYNACGQPVFFVQDGWYRDVYAPRYDGDARRREDRRDSRRGDRHDDERRGNGKFKNGHGRD